MKIITPGKPHAIKRTLYDCDYTCPRCGAVLRLEPGDKVLTERSMDGRSYFRCGWCNAEIAVRWNGAANLYEVQP